MAVQLPPGVTQMLAKVLGQPATAGAKGEAKALTGQPGAAAQPGAHGPEGPKKGAPLGDGTVLTGVGFNGQDRTGAHKNVNEKESVARFLKDPELDKLVGRPKAEAKEGADEVKQQERAQDAKELRDAQRAEAKREDKADEAKQLHTREAQREEREQERERERQRQEDRQHKQQHKDDQPQSAHAEAEPEAEEPTPQDGQHDADALGETSQCKGHTEDGQRCLRRPLEGSSYCREHLTTAGVPRTVSV